VLKLCDVQGFAAFNLEEPPMSPFRFEVYTNLICCLTQKAPATISLLSQPVRRANPALLFGAVLLDKAVFNNDAFAPRLPPFKIHNAIL
jgi:hypothetical protein